jgi:hypothetical protein
MATTDIVRLAMILTVVSAAIARWEFALSLAWGLGWRLTEVRCRRRSVGCNARRVSDLVSDTFMEFMGFKLGFEIEFTNYYFHHNLLYCFIKLRQTRTWPDIDVYFLLCPGLSAAPRPQV